MKNFNVKQKFLLGCIMMFVSLMSYGQVDTTSIVKKSAYLENKKTSNVDFQFGKDKWQQLIIKLNGTYHKDITKKPSQSFTVFAMIGGKKRDIFNGEVYGAHDPIVIDLDNKDNEDLNVSVNTKLKSVHGASTYSAGGVEVIAFREKPGAFYVTSVVYDTGSAVILNEEPQVTTLADIHNNGLTEMEKKCEVKYQEKKSIIWEKSFSHSESVAISVGYKAGSAGGLEGMISLQANFKTDYKNGRSEETVRERNDAVTVTVPPKNHYKVLMEQTQSSL